MKAVVEIGNYMDSFLRSQVFAEVQVAVLPLLDWKGEEISRQGIAKDKVYKLWEFMQTDKSVKHVACVHLVLPASAAAEGRAVRLLPQQPEAVLL